MPTEPREERYRPWALIGITVLSLAGFAVFFLSFLVAPMAILIIFYVGFSLSDRSKRKAREKAGRQAEAAQPVVVVTEPAPTTAGVPAETRTYRRSM